MREKVTFLITVALLSIVFSSTTASAKEVTVKNGDTLWSISQENQTTVEQLGETNQLNSTTIYPGQTLNIATDTKASSKVITVKEGDSLWKISQIHNTTVESLKEVNQLTSNFIYPGQTLTASSEEVSSVTTATTEDTSSAAEAKGDATVSGKELTVTATAYTASCGGCSGITATGINLIENPDQKVIAVDPSVIPLGSTVYVEGYGTAIAGDTGGAIKGNKIDVFIPNSSNAYEWGVKTVKVTIIS